MTTLVVETKIQAPIELCFDLARDVKVHCVTAAQTKERIVGGKSSGLLELGDSVTFEGVHLGVRQKLAVTITECHRPHCFIDEMTNGAFKWLKHVHEFEPIDNGTLMRDTIEWKSPLGFLGEVADRLLVERHLRKFLLERNRELKRIAEQRAQEELLKPST
jgi:ligand-binding SRPBCC domain-containing protein